MTTNKREDISLAALNLFTERGFDATTVPMIADTAKVGAGTIYRYFDNKEVLLNSLFQECVEQFFQTITQGFPESGTVRQQFHHIFSQTIHFAKANREAFSFIDSHLNPRLLDDKSLKSFEVGMDFIRHFLVQGQQQGIISLLPPNALISIFYGALVKLFETIRAEVLEETDELLAGVEECCWNAIRVH
ncbi:TetR family transcriptional regulator [Paenibacillus sp. MER TA 81-3]|uniref:TetR/AcrR family transcriptional regulator n=1 Tax=Paenibacillus sp. MER TA 81-3 TaxID=2939573 RepID=UPI002041A409|nr:TetR/AcrR family transcriptional regulator [Paenibacillus sp. MER TA 81-3]MCM3340732.1 TetR family transcriptional regulator [Paenibacillus sp. MER TA 81-3]